MLLFVMSVHKPQPVLVQLLQEVGPIAKYFESLKQRIDNVRGLQIGQELQKPLAPLEIRHPVQLVPVCVTFIYQLPLVPVQSEH
jgi:hypothetical protein